MEYVTYKNEKISKLLLGTVQFGLNYGIANKHGKPKEEDVKEILKYVLENGINSFDTAQTYGTSEEVLGKVLPFSSTNKIISKCSSEIFSFSALNSLKESLKRLNTTSLYALLLHDTSLLKSWSVKENKILKSLKKEKLISHFGISIYTNEEFMLAINNEAIELIQIPFNLFDQRALKYKWFELAKKSNKLLIIRSVFLQGLFFMQEKNLDSSMKEVTPHLQSLDKLSKELNLSRQELALTFANHNLDSPILFGCETLVQAYENIVAYKNLRVLTPLEIKKIYTTFKNVKENVYNPTFWGKND